MGRKAGISTAERLLRDEISRSISDTIGNERGAQARAARQLGIPRQTLNLYLKKRATPGSEILRRILALWNLTFKVEGATINSTTWSATQAGNDDAPTQMTLFDAISEVGNQQLEIEVLRKTVDSIDLKVSIDFKRALRKA